MRSIGGNTLSRQQLLEMINDKQNIVLGRDIRLMRILPDPCIHTTAGDYVYTANDAVYDSIDNTTQYDIRNIARVYTTTMRNIHSYQYDGLIQTTHFPETLVNPLNSDEVKIPVDVSISNRAEADDCEIKFWRENDPGTHTDRTYLCEAYRWPTQLAGEQQAFEIPDPYVDLIRLLVLIEIEEDQYGSASPRLYEQYDILNNKFMAYANKGASAEELVTMPREV